MVLLAFLAAAEEGAHAGPASPFEVNFGLFFWTWVVFIALFLVLRRFAWPAILAATEAREQSIQRQLAEAAAAREQAQQALEEQKKLLAEARDASTRMLAETRGAIERERAAATEKTRAEQDELIARARREISAERERALAAIRAEAVDLSLAAATKLIGQRLDAEGDRRIVTEYLTGLEVAK